MMQVFIEKHVRNHASERAEPRALWKKNTLITRDRMFFGAFVKAYSRPVMDAKISEKATSTYLNNGKSGMLVVNNLYQP